MVIHIEQVDTSSAPEPLLEELADYYVAVEDEDMPGDPPTPMEMQIAGWRHIQARYPIFRWIMREDGVISAVAVAAYDKEQNLENGYGRVHVHRDKRGRGYARTIAEPMLDHLEQAGRRRFDTWVKTGDPAETLLERLGLKAAYHERRSRLTIADLDMGLMRSWVERAAERAGDYELRYFETPYPEEIIEGYCDLAFIMNTAPREDFVSEDEVLTPEMWRDTEATVLGEKSTLHTYIAVHQPTQEYVGYTTIKTQELQPDLAWQWDTGVHPEHRNRGLGRWLKAAMIDKIVADYPAMDRVDTFNAGSNEPMLDINIAMGFKPVHLSQAWQGDLATVRERWGV
jgi:GNAT superfamily N-acetyltransferase